MQTAIKKENLIVNRIYVACLSSYNAGKLHGTWIDLDYKSVDEVEKEIELMLKASSEPYAEEYAIHDFEGIRCEENTDIATIVEKVETLNELDDSEKTAFLAFLDYENNGTLENFRDSYQGHWDNEKEYAIHLFDECYLDEMPEHLTHYIDYEAFRYDLFLDHFSIDAKPYGVFVFSNNY
tara:strand:- start:781 stop:1320 length:540 start_codon:yes stop_codon:yes gene_type:complete